VNVLPKTFKCSPHLFQKISQFTVKVEASMNYSDAQNILEKHSQM